MHPSSGSIQHTGRLESTKQMTAFSAAEVEAVALDAIRLMVRQLDKCVNREHIAYAINCGQLPADVDPWHLPTEVQTMLQDLQQPVS